MGTLSQVMVDRSFTGGFSRRYNQKLTIHGCRVSLSSRSARPRCYLPISDNPRSGPTAIFNSTYRKYMGTKASEFNELVRGASINQLAALFDLDRRTVSNRLKDVQPCGKRNSFPIYKISEVAELLVVGYMTGDQITETQKRQRADKEKDYWDAKLKEQKYLVNMGDLWRTERIVEVFSVVFKQIRESVTVFLDKLEHESGLPAKQIENAKHFGDALLVEMRDNLMSLDLDPEGEHVLPDEPRPVADDEPEDDELSDADLEELGLL